MDDNQWNWKQNLGVSSITKKANRKPVLVGLSPQPFSSGLDQGQVSLNSIFSFPRIQWGNESEVRLHCCLRASGIFSGPAPELTPALRTDTWLCHLLSSAAPCPSPRHENSHYTEMALITFNITCCCRQRQECLITRTTRFLTTHCEDLLSTAFFK